jgi:hypothetical protein
VPQLLTIRRKDTGDYLCRTGKGEIGFLAIDSIKHGQEIYALVIESSRRGSAIICLLSHNSGYISRQENGTFSFHRLKVGTRERFSLSAVDKTGSQRRFSEFILRDSDNRMLLDGIHLCTEELDSFIGARLGIKIPASRASFTSFDFYSLGISEPPWRDELAIPPSPNSLGDIIIHDRIYKLQMRNGHSATTKAFQAIRTGCGEPFHPGASHFKPEAIRLCNCFVTNEGLIQQVNNFGFGACHRVSFDYENGENLTTAKYPVLTAAAEIPTIGNVVSICGVWAHAIWHFPGEALSSLCALESWPDNAYLHVPAITDWTRQWIATLPFKIPAKRIITGTIFAQTLWVPRQGPCGLPTPEQISYLRKCALEACKDTPTSSDQYLALVRRTKARPTANYDGLMEACVAYCKAANLKLRIHDDRHLPSLKDQLTIFRDAAVVVMPHGAAGILTVCCKAGTPIIEFLNQDSPPCYISLSYYLGFSHYCLSAQNNRCDIKALQKVFNLLLTKTSASKSSFANEFITAGIPPMQPPEDRSRTSGTKGKPRLGQHHLKSALYSLLRSIRKPWLGRQ